MVLRSLSPFRGQECHRQKLCAMLLQFTIAFLVFPYVTLLPIFARDIFHIGAAELGLLNAAAGTGALPGAILVVAISQRKTNGLRLLMGLCLVGGVICLTFALSRSQNASLLLLILLGSCTVMTMTITNTFLQSMTPEHMRGRVLSLWVMVAFGFAPFGNLVAGWIAQSLGAPMTLAIGGGLCAAIALFIAFLQWLHHRQSKDIAFNLHAFPLTIIPHHANRS